MSVGQREESSSSFLRQEQEDLVPRRKQRESKHIATSSFITSLKPKEQTPTGFSSIEQSPKLGESFLLVYKADGTGNMQAGQSDLLGEGEGSWAIDAAAFKLFVKNLLKHFARKNLHPPPQLMGGKGGSKMRTREYFTVKYCTKQSIILNMISWGKRHAIIGAVNQLIHRTCTLLASSTGKHQRHAQARIRKEICGSWAFPFPFIAPPWRSTCSGFSHWSWCVCRP